MLSAAPPLNVEGDGPPAERAAGGVDAAGAATGLGAPVSAIARAIAAGNAARSTARSAEREAPHAAWRATLLRDEAGRAKLHTLGVSLVRALAAQDDDAALLFLAQLPLDERLKCGALSQRWRRLVATPSLYTHISFDDVALPGRFMACGDDTSAVTDALGALLGRAGRALRSVDVRALDQVWCKAQSSRWPIIRAATLMYLLGQGCKANASNAAQPRALEELRLSHGAPFVLLSELRYALPPACPRMARLDCRVFLMLDHTAAAVLRRLPAAGDVAVVLVKNEESNPTPQAAAGLVDAVCAALGAAPAVTALSFSYGDPTYRRQVASFSRPNEGWKRGLEGAIVAALAAGLQAQQGLHRVRALSLVEAAVTREAIRALEELLRSCAAAGDAAALNHLDLRGATGLNRSTRKSLLAAAAGVVEVLVD